MKYRAITAENFYQTEFKNACRYIENNPEIEDLKSAFKEEDILDTVSESNFQKKYLSISKRLKHLNEELIHQVNAGDATTSRFINLYTILCCERIIAEFMDEVVKEKYRSYDYYLTDRDFNIFLERKAEQSDIVGNWTEGTLKKIKVKMKKFLMEGEFLYKDGEDFKITRPLILSEVIDEMENKSIVEAMLY